MAVSKFEYPRLSRSDISAILAEYQIANVTEHDLINPTSDFISELYTRILLHLQFFLQDDNEQLEFDALEQLENPDHHVESVRAMKLYNRIKEVLDALECPKKFTLNDLIAPDPRRAEFFLGALLNFCLDREVRMSSLSEIVNEFNVLEEQRAELEVKILQLKSEISECNEAREREMPLVQEVDVKVKELRQTIAALNNQQMSLKTNLRKLKEKSGEMDEKISNAEFTLVQNVQENANLRSKIAQSPDKVQRALEEKKLVREEARNAERLAMQNFHEKTALVEIYSKVYKKMTKHYKQMQAIQEQVNSVKTVEKELKALKTKLSDEEVLEQTLGVKLVEKQSKVEQMEELRKQVEKECNVMREEATKHLQSIKLEVESKRGAMEARQRNVESVLAEVEAINGKIKAIKESEEAKVNLLRLKCEEVVKEYRKYAEQIAHVMESGTNAQEP
ncbi:hypothetical protein RIF29_05155 [Crotalaria pallida]|uniref:Kinetochore protein Nuf2 N-terminal domain-containing protein n=1 Tax=Crotalaria pallida TaxID=3830 RepID=A0AAN9J2J0_CROPI